MSKNHKIIFEARAGGDIPEEPELSFRTTDLQGGGYSHGAKAELTLSSDNGHFTFIIEAGDKRF
jgi:hypothetical protein